MSENNVSIRLREAKQDMTPVEKKVAEYVETQLGSIPSLSIKELAHKSKTSEASVLRFCKTLGYKGYRDFTLSLSSALGSMSASDTAGAYTDICAGDDLATIIDNISLNNCRSIEDTLTVLDKGEVARAVDALLHTQRIDFYGVGASGLVCQDAQQKFLRINKRCLAFIDGHSLLTAAALLSPCDVAVLISNSGDTLEILDTLELVKRSKATTIAITRYSKSPLASNADILLNISTPEITFRSGAMGSRIAMLNIIDILFTAVASSEHENVKQYLALTHDALTSRHRY